MLILLKMTNLVKAITEKKADKKDEPLLVNDNIAETGKKDVESQHAKADVGRHYFLSLRSIHRIRVIVTFLIFLVTLMIIITGVIGGLYIYCQYARTQMHRFKTGWFTIPCDANKLSYDFELPGSMIMSSNMLLNSAAKAAQQGMIDMEKNIDNDVKKFKERIEIDLEDEHYEKIDVLDFYGGSPSRFIHDFISNRTGIIDIDGQRCFVMPLNRQTVLSPRDMYDLLKRMYNGYSVNTEIIAETLKVVTPPITDMSIIETYIASECRYLPTYMLVKVNWKVVKRSVSSGVFGQFAGKNIIVFDILNLGDIDKYEKKLKN